MMALNAEREAFVAGIRYGAEATVAATDPLFDFCAQLFAASAHGPVDVDRDALDDFVGEVADSIRRIREGDEQAMAMWALRQIEVSA